jgi:hypothetical protein
MILAYFVIWVITILLALGVIGGIVKLSTQGFDGKEFISLILVMVILVVFATIALTGSFTI